VRSPLTLALTALDLDEVTEGRFILGLGTGVARLNQDWHNAHFGRPTRHLRETVSIVREVIGRSHEGEPIEIEGDDERISLHGYRRPFPPSRQAVPIYIGSMGPMMSRLAGEIADGWIALEIGSPSHFKSEIRPQIEAGLSQAGRDRNAIELVASACCVIHPSSHEAKRRLAGLVAFYASVRTYTSFFAWHGFEREALAIQERSRLGDTTGMIDACPDEMVDTFALAGTPDEVRKKLTAYEGIVDSIKLSPPTHHVSADVTREAQQSILELFSV
jgi:alkanesulfonate monooxygenase SsuD/methylene tetrahydromethanopterin reductase-like flavin-dependent oxidoreductase (luciferase family)